VTNDEHSPHSNVAINTPLLTFFLHSPNMSTSSTFHTSMDISPAPTPAPDASMSRADALAYWESINADDNGMLGGYPQVSRIDIQGSSTFLAKIRRLDTDKPDGTSNNTTVSSLPFDRAVDCGAGIGRITLNLLVHQARTIDIVEPVAKFTDALAAAFSAQSIAANANGITGTLGAIHNLGLEDFHPGPASYDLIWNQWCVGQLTDTQLIAYLKRCGTALRRGGWIVVKENMSSRMPGPGEQDIFDATDSSVTRGDGSFRRIFEEAGLEVKATEVQRGMPRELFPVRAYGLRPEGW